MTFEVLIRKTEISNMFRKLKLLFQKLILRLKFHLKNFFLNFEGFSPDIILNWFNQSSGAAFKSRKYNHCGRETFEHIQAL